MTANMIIEIGGVISVLVMVYGIFYKFDKSIDVRMEETKKLQIEMNNNQIKHTVVLDSMLNEITEIKEYKVSIEQNGKDIALERQERIRDVSLINQRCSINHKGGNAE